MARRLWRRYQHRRKLDGRLALRTLIIGSTGEAIRLAKALMAPGSGFLPLGYVQPHGATEAGDTLPVLGGIDQLRELMADQSVDCLFVASTLVDSDALAVVSQAARKQGVQVLVSANMTHVLGSRLVLQQVGSVIALSLRPVRLSGTQAVAKRAFDLVMGSFLLVATLPIWLAAAVAIRLTSPEPVLFHQERSPRAAAPSRCTSSGACARTSRPAPTRPRRSSSSTRTPHHAGGPPAAQVEPGRAAPALERDPRRDEPGRAPAPAHRAGDRESPIARSPPRGAGSSMTVVVADQRPQRRRPRAGRPPGRVLHRELVAGVRLLHHPEDHLDGGRAQGRLLRRRPRRGQDQRRLAAVEPLGEP